MTDWAANTSNLSFDLKQVKKTNRVGVIRIYACEDHVKPSRMVVVNEAGSLFSQKTAQSPHVV